MRQLIRTDGTVEDIPAPLTMTEYRRMIGAETLDTVCLKHLGEPLIVMLVDDAGYEVKEVKVGPGRYELRTIKALKPVNAMATALYLLNCIPATSHQIVGDVIVCYDQEFA